MNLTPTHWRHTRIIEGEKAGTFSVVSYYTRSRFGPMALAALNQPPDTKTEGIARAAALALGEKLEKKLVDLNGRRGAKARQS